MFESYNVYLELLTLSFRDFLRFPLFDSFNVCVFIVVLLYCTLFLWCRQLCRKVIRGVVLNTHINMQWI